MQAISSLKINGTMYLKIELPLTPLPAGNGDKLLTKYDVIRMAEHNDLFKVDARYSPVINIDGKWYMYPIIFGNKDIGTRGYNEIIQMFTHLKMWIVELEGNDFPKDVE